MIHDIFEDPAKGGQAPYQVYRMASESGEYTPAIILINDQLEVDKRSRSLRNRWQRKLRQVASEQRRFVELKDASDEEFEEHR